MAQNLRIRQTSLVGGMSDDSFIGGIAGRFGQQVMMDWMQYMVLAGMGYQVRAGTITTPLVGDVVLTDTAAEMSVDVAASTGTIIPMSMGIGIRLAGGTLHEYAVKSVATVSSAGTTFVPLPLRSSGPSGATAAAAALTTARVSAAGGVTVTAELSTTTLRHWEYSNPVAAGAGNDPGLAAIRWEPRVAPILVGPRCLYVQIAATTTGPSYYAHLDYIECPTSSLF